MADEAKDATTELPASRAARPRRRPPTTIDDRVRLLTKALDLDPKQQVALRGVLEDQRQ
jgi:hypothetical protein